MKTLSEYGLMVSFHIFMYKCLYENLVLSYFWPFVIAEISKYNLGQEKWKSSTEKSFYWTILFLSRATVDRN